MMVENLEFFYYKWDSFVYNTSCQSSMLKHVTFEFRLHSCKNKGNVVLLLCVYGKQL